MYKSCPTYILGENPFYLTGRPDDKMFEKSVDISGKELKPKKIIFNYPATIVFWNDGTKTVVKCATGTEPDMYNAFCAALAKKIYGTNSRLKRIIETAAKVIPPRKQHHRLKKSTKITFDNLHIGDKVRLLDGSNIENFVGGWTQGMEEDVVLGIKEVQNNE